jgi:dihydrolipoamide dehydrogenase
MQKTDEVLGGMIGARTADLIAEAVVMEFKASAEDISRMSHAHPTLQKQSKSCISSY